MSENVQIILIGNVYRIVCVLIAFGFCYLGYRLYVRGVLEKEGEIKGRFGTWEVIVKNVAPGAVFVILGVIVGAFGIARPISIQEGPTTTVPTASNLSEPAEAIDAKVKKRAELIPEESRSHADLPDKLAKPNETIQMYDKNR